MPATISVQTMCNLMVKNRLRDVEDVKALYQQWMNESPRAEDAELFRHYLVGHGIFTDYQATLLAHGRTEGYFIDRFKVVNLIGQGRMAGVYDAVSADGRHFALKVLPPVGGNGVVHAGH